MRNDTCVAQSDATAHKTAVGLFQYQRFVRDLDPAHLKRLAAKWKTSTTAMKFVALTMSTYADIDGQEVWPGDENIQHNTGYSRAVIEKARRAIEDLGLLICIRRGSPGHNGKYQLSVPTSLAGKERAPCQQGTEPLSYKGHPPPPQGETALVSEGPPVEDQLKYQPTYQSPRNARAEDDAAGLSRIACCTPMEAAEMISVAKADPATKHSPVGRLMKVPAYRERILREIRKKHKNERQQRFSVIPDKLVKCKHDDSLLPTTAGKPKCALCRKSGVRALTEEELDILVLGVT